MPVQRFSSTKRKKTPDKEWRALDRAVQRLKGKDIGNWDLKVDVHGPKKKRR